MNVCSGLFNVYSNGGSRHRELTRLLKVSVCRYLRQKPFLWKLFRLGTTSVFEIIYYFLFRIFIMLVSDKYDKERNYV